MYNTCITHCLFAWKLFQLCRKNSSRNILCRICISVTDSNSNIRNGIVISPLQHLFYSYSRSLRNEVLCNINTSIDTSLMALTVIESSRNQRRGTTSSLISRVSSIDIGLASRYLLRKVFKPNRIPSNSPIYSTIVGIKSWDGHGMEMFVCDHRRSNEHNPFTKRAFKISYSQQRKLNIR